MAEFWDERAAENAAFFVDNQLDYANPDLERFWSGGEEALAQTLGPMGVEIGPADAVVEIGCGIGRITRAISSRARIVTAIDVSAEMLRRAREHNPGLANVEWLLGDGRSLAGLPDGSADACFSFVVFQHIPDPAVTLGYVREMGRVLRPDGWSCFQVSNDPAVHDRSRGASGLWHSLLVRMGRRPGGQDAAPWIGSAVDLEDLERVAREAGMEVERVTGEGTQFCMVMLRRSSA